MTWIANTGSYPKGLQDDDTISVKFVYRVPAELRGDNRQVEEERPERDVKVKGIYWGMDRPVYVKEWARV